MRQMRKAGSTQTSVIVVILLVAMMFVAYSIFSTQREQSPAKLIVSLPPLGAKSGQAVQFPINIGNDGGGASQVSVSLSSSAFGPINLNPVDIGSGQTFAVYASTNVKDVQNGWYDITVSYTFRDINGTHAPASTKARFYVLPLVKVTDFAWDGPINRWPPKDTIGRTDSTKFFFRVQSSSLASTFVRLSASAKVTTAAQSLSISPSIQPIENIGPQGKTQEYSFIIQSNNTPPGKYNVTITIASDDWTAAEYTVVLTVS